MNVAVLRMAVEKSYYDHANPDLLSRIPTNSLTVLEVGCGGGALGHAYKMINPSAQYLGIELMETPAKLAKERLDQVWRIDIEDMKIQFQLPEKYPSIDALIYGDVLERLKDPQKILREHVSWLSPDGVVVASIPNVQHWSVIYNLIQGNWPQDDTGIFNKTHLRWFTRNSIVELFASLELKITSLQPRFLNLEQAKNFAKILEPCLEKMAILNQSLFQKYHSKHYIPVRNRFHQLFLSMHNLQPGVLATLLLFQGWDSRVLVA